MTKKKHIPLDLRPKRTRSIRRRLSTKQQTLKTLKQTKKEQNFPQRRFALKA
jgi:large subunit ribosomal protein L35e